MRILALILCADSYSDAESRHMQSHLMRLAMEPTHQRSKGESDRLWFYFRLFEEKNDEPCTWRGVECEGGIARTLIFRRMYQPNMGVHCDQVWIVDMRWLPSTVREMSFYSIDLFDGWQACALPRDLKFMYLSSCDSRRNQSTPKGHQIDFRKLPQRMEELIIYDGWWAGPLVISALPATMQICFVLNDSIKRAFVDNAQLPESFELFSVFPNEYKFTVKERNKDLLDVRIRIRDTRYVASKFNKLSKYLRKLDVIAQRIQSENRARDIPGFSYRGVDL